MFGLFGKNKKEKTEAEVKRFFSVALGEKMVQAALWETQENIRVLAKSEARPYFNKNDLLVKLDTCLQELGVEGESVHQTLFHLDSSFVVGQDIQADKKLLFQKVTESLQLESLGFVTNTEAVINAKLEQTPDLEKQLVVEFVSTHTVYSLYDKKTLVESLEVENRSNFCQQFCGALVQLAGQLGEDYAHYFEQKNELAPAPKEAQPLFVNFISALISSEEIGEKITKLPAALPMRAECLGSDILLTYTLVPSATIIARSYGWLKPIEVDDEEKEAASEPPVAMVDLEEEEAIPVLSRQKNFKPPTIEPTDLGLKEKKDEAKKMEPKTVKLIVLAAVVLGAMVAVAVAAFLVVTGAKAQITIWPKRSSLNKNLEVVVDPTAKEADYDSLILPGEILSGDLTHTVSVATTGQKDVGEPAKGKIEITNKKTESRTLKKGTEIEDGKVSFRLDDDVTVDAATENSDGLSYSKAEVNVTAVTLGTSGNVKSGATFRVGSYVREEMEAKAVSDFSGGVDKYVQVVAEADQTQALALAKEELLEAASEQIGSKKDDTYLAVQLAELKILTSEYSAKVGAEATEVSVAVTASVPVIAYKLDELEPLAKATLEKELEGGWQLLGETPNLLSAVDEKKTANGKGKIYIEVDLSQEIIRVLDLEAIKKEILGQNLTRVENFLKSYEGIKSYELVWENTLAPQLLGRLPKASDQLLLEVKTD